MLNNEFNPHMLYSIALLTIQILKEFISLTFEVIWLRLHI